MITSFNTSRENASSTDATPTIREPGKYICTIVMADTFERHTQNGDYQFVRFLLQNDQKQRATIELCVAGGKSDWQKKQFDAFCICANVTNPSFVKANIKNHRRGVADEQVVEGYRCRELENKRIGVLLQRVWRDWVDNRTGELRESFDLTLVKPFDPETERTASEIIQNVEKPTKLAAAIEGAMKDRDLRKGAGNNQRPASSSGASASAPAAHASTPVYDEDCPF